MSQKYIFPKTPNTSTLRSLLTDAFSDESFSSFCFDHFPTVHEQFSDGMTLSRKIQLLVDHCQRHGLFDDLLEQIHKYNPYQYNLFAGKLMQVEEDDDRVSNDTSPTTQANASHIISTSGGDIATNNAKIIKSNSGNIIEGDKINIEGNINIKSD